MVLHLLKTLAGLLVGVAAFLVPEVAKADDSMPYQRVLLTEGDLATASTPLALARVLEHAACPQISKSAKPGDGVFMTPESWTLIGPRSRVTAVFPRATRLILVPDDLNHCVRVAFLNDDRTDFLNDDIKKIVNRVWEDVQHKDNSSVTLEFAPTGTAATWPFQIFIQFDVEFQSGAFLDEKKEAIASFDLNKTIADRVAWICLTPIASAASTITIEASDLAVADIRGRALVTFGGKRLKLERVKKDANLWCAPIGGTGDTPVSISNDGLATDDVHLLYRGTEYGDRIAPRHWNVRVLVKPYAVAGVSLPMCDDCRRSFIPANVTTVRAIFPIVQFAGGWPKVFEARVDLGISPGLLIAQNSASSAMGLGLAPLGGLCFAIDAGASPRVCGFATLDFVGVSATKAGDTSATIKFAVQPNAMAVLGLSL